MMMTRRYIRRGVSYTHADTHTEVCQFRYAHFTHTCSFTVSLNTSLQFHTLMPTHTYIYISSSVQHESHSRIGGRGSSSFLSTPLPALSSDSMLTCPVYNPAGLVYCSGTLFAFLLPEFPIRGPPSLTHTHTDSSIHDDTRLRVSVFPPPVTVSLSLSLCVCVLLDFE